MNRLIASIALALIFASLSYVHADAQRKPGYTAPPNRHDIHPGGCPPLLKVEGKYEKAPLDTSVDKGGNYFEGSWTFIDADGNDLIVTEWCVSNPPSDGHWEDYFSWGISTSAGKEAAEEAQVTPPDDHI
jgi:hypothetical protein